MDVANRAGVQFPLASRSPLLGSPVGRQQRTSAFKSSRRQFSKRGPRQVQVQAAAKTGATDQVYLCIDCGYIYDGRAPFAQLPKDYVCPVCQAPKRRFKLTKRPGPAGGKRGPIAGSGEGVNESDAPTLLAGGAAILAVVAAVYVALSSQF